LQRVTRRCIQAEPQNGEQWKKVMKDPEMAKLNPSTEQILKQAVLRISKMKGIML